MVRYFISVAITIGFGMILGFRVTTNPASAIVGCLLLLLAFALAMCWVSALIGNAGEDAAGSAGLRVYRVLPAGVRQQPARADLDDARLVVGLRQG